MPGLALALLALGLESSGSRGGEGQEVGEVEEEEEEQAEEEDAATLYLLLLAGVEAGDADGQVRLQCSGRKKISRRSGNYCLLKKKKI